MCLVHDVPDLDASEVRHDGTPSLTVIESTQGTLVRTLCFFSPPPDGSKPCYMEPRSIDLCRKQLVRFRAHYLVNVVIKPQVPG